MITIVGAFVAAAGLVMFFGNDIDRSLRLPAVIAVTAGAGILSAGLALRYAAGKPPTGHFRRPNVVTLAVTLALTAVSAAAIVFFLAAFYANSSLEFVRRYGMLVEADIGGQECRIWRSRTGNVDQSCDATWTIDGATRRGRLFFTDDAAPGTGSVRRAHVMNDDPDAAYTAPRQGTPPSRDSHLVLGRFPAWPLWPALGVFLLTWIFVPRWKSEPLGPPASPPHQ